MKKEQTVAERIYEQLEAGNLEMVLELKNKFLALEQIDLRMQFEKGALDAMYKLALK